MANTLALTGATGFIGQALLRPLVAAGWEVHALCRAESWHRRSPLTGVGWIKGSMEDESSLHCLLDRADAVIHCAGSVRGITRADFDRINAYGMQTLVHAAIRKAVPRLIALSSLAAREPSLSHYGASKREGERILAEKAGDMAWTILRPPAVYGPGDKELRPLFQCLERGIAPVPGAANGRISLVYIDDLVEAIKALLNCPAAHGMTFTLHDGHSNGYGWDQVIAIATSLCGRPIRQWHIPPLLLHAVAAVNLALSRPMRRLPMFSPGKVREFTHPDWSCDNTALTQATGWEPKILLEEGLRRTMGWSGFAGKSHDS